MTYSHWGVTTITIFVWITFDVYRILKKPATINLDSKTLEPIDPVFDENVLFEIEERKVYDLTNIILPTPTPPILIEEETPNTATDAGVITEPANQQ